MIDWNEFQAKEKEMATLRHIREILVHGFGQDNPSLARCKAMTDVIQEALNGMDEADEQYAKTLNTIDHETL